MKLNYFTMSACINDQTRENTNDGDDNNNKEEEEEEDDDVDFNPFLKERLSPEVASSSLSSELEEELLNEFNSNLLNPNCYDVGDSEHGEQVVKQNGNIKRKFDSVEQNVNGNCGEEVEGEEDEDEDDDDDAIWKRTRARYSLASFTLDELETFLQETDDEDDLQNVDDQEEYRKFLAAVLLGSNGDGDGQDKEGNGNVAGEDEDDEDNDADFEIGLEELLESDVDDDKRDNIDKKVESERSRRPETRQNRRQKASDQYKRKLLEQTKRPLRPYLPIVPSGPMTSHHPVDGRDFMPEIAPCYVSSAAQYGFTPQQIGQLHCLIYEHVQLLLQIFSLSILDPSRQQIASQVQGMLSEVLHKREEVMAFRNFPYPSICFHPPYMCPSVPSSAPSMQMSVTQSVPTTPGGLDGAWQAAGSFWSPFTSGPIISILDVAPLNLVGDYVDDVSNAVREYRRRHLLDSGCDPWNEKEPLFSLPQFESNGAVLNENIPLAVTAVPSTPGQQPPKKTLAASIVENVKKQSVALVPKNISKLAQRFLPLFNPALFPYKPPPASVANRILFTDSEDELLALGVMEFNTDWKAIQQRFLPCKTKHQIFVRQKNRCSSKAPENPIKAVRRMKTSPLTLEEVEAIQEGLKAFRLDWTAVWRLIVPHRDPSLLPRQWRTALGTQRSYKFDDAKREKRRQYELNRRKRKTAGLTKWHDREDNQADSAGGENNSGDDYIDNPGEAYVHQAFLADWRPDASKPISSERSCLNLGDKNLPTGAFVREGAHIRNQSHIVSMHGFPYVCHYPYPNNFPYFTHVKHGPSKSVQLHHQVYDTMQSADKSHSSLRPVQTRRIDGARLVKLAPDLPPVNLPPSVRIISQVAFKSHEHGVPSKSPAPGGTSTGDTGKNNMDTRISVANSRNASLAAVERNKSNQVGNKITNPCVEELRNSHPEESAAQPDICDATQRGTESDLQMHPLLFQSPEDGRLSYYPLSCSAGYSSSFTFLSANQPQLNLSLFHSPHPANHISDRLNMSSKTKESASASCGIDFHPLLQRTEGNGDFSATCSNAQQDVRLGDKSGECQNSSGAIHSRSSVDRRPSATVAKPSCPLEKINELDLEIHLSSTCMAGKTMGSRDFGASNQLASSISKPNMGNTIENHKSRSPHHKYSENSPTVSGNFVSSADALTVPSNNDNRCNMDDIEEQSLPGIVMEQEELSDSDEETEEQVEFECEEMADSDGEEALDCEPMAEVQDKEFSSFGTDEVTAAGGNKQSECRSPTHPRGNASESRKGSPSSKLTLTGLGKDASNSSWLSLDSSQSMDPPSTKAMHEECMISSCPVPRWGRLNRSSKRSTASTKAGPAEQHVTSMARQLSLGVVAGSTVKKPRKRASRVNKNLCTGKTNENSNCDQDKIG